MTRQIMILALLAVAIVSSPVIAQKKLYKWTDADGNVHYSDNVPPEAIDKARDEFNVLGRVIDHVDRALTPEEFKLKQAQEEAARIEDLRVKEQLAADRKLMSIYASEADITRSKQQQTDVINRSIATAQSIADGQTRSLGKLMERAAQMEGQGIAVSEATQSSIKEIRRQIELQTGYLKRLEADKAASIEHFEQELIRFREVKKRWGLTPSAKR